MKFKIILFLLAILTFSQNCEKQSRSKRKIKLIRDNQYSKTSKSKNEQTVVLKFDGEEKRSIAILTFENQTKFATALGIANAATFDVCNVSADEANEFLESVKVEPLGKKMKIINDTPD